ncbi:ring-cleaving dioxygenase [Evansella sp. LMS18]|uniref:ring-cleaving dioxygenase n=1 Tax=Evansella sp. LMS18 TaxID=2924033 RepID=UPI0020D05EDB|nr:ring-cleaving dioxygenase [Evansella sp. LMS18]UTR09797.1 ring-cleaving dioxygenase [Evansella sp. LMS18]
MNMKPLFGQHHVSAITADAEKNYQFYTEIMGMRLVKKTVNQDSTSMYHLFYADERGNPGTDLTFFEIQNAGRTYPGTNSITGTSLRVADDAALDYWLRRFEDFKVDHDGIERVGGRAQISFRDFENQRLLLVSDETNKGVPGGTPWEGSPVPGEFGILGLGPVQLTVSRPERTAKVLTEILGFRETGSISAEGAEEKNIRVFHTGEGGTGAEVQLIEEADKPRERPGRGSVHHVAFRVESEAELRKWTEFITEAGFSNSGFVERYYFKSLYFREPNGILIELATDGPGFESDESFEELGENLALPPFLESRREEIEKSLKPLNTKQ